MALSDLILRIGTDISKLKSGLNDAERRLRRSGQNMQTLGKNLATNVSLPILGLGAAAVKSAADLEKLETSFNVLLGSTSAGKAFFEDIKDFSSRTPFQLQDISQAASGLLAFGFGAEEAKDALGFLGDIAAATNSNLGDLTTILGQARAIGAVYTQDLRQLANRGIPVFDLLKEKFQVSGEELDKMVTSGAISFEILQDVLKDTTREGGLFAGALQAQSQTLSGSFSTLRDNVVLALGELGTSIAETVNLTGIVNTLSGAIRGLAKGFADLSPTTKKIIIGVAAFAAAVGPALFAVGALTKAVAVLRVGFAVITGPIGITIAAITALATAIGFAWNRSSAFRKSVIRLGKIIQQMGSILIDSALKPIRSLGEAWDALANGQFGRAARIIGRSVAEGLLVIPNATAKIVSSWNEITDNANEAADAFERVREENKKAKDEISKASSTTPAAAAIIPAIAPTGSSNAKPARAAISALPDLSGARTVSDNISEETITQIQRLTESYSSLGQSLTEQGFKIDETNLKFEKTVRIFDDLKGTMAEVAEGVGSSLTQLALSGETNFRKLGKAALGAAAQVARANIVKAVTSFAADAFGKLGVFGAPLAAAAGGIVGVIFNKLIGAAGIPALADGGIVRKPTLALIGEAGPEAVVPLSKGGGFGMDDRQLVASINLDELLIELQRRDKVVSRTRGTSIF